ncbi:MarR family winged helix-turn-helix transcriptional regulator [Spirillospora sp. NPDC048911]|uniref:MarR family winged helix-turn-helix transcriptional regulator n=1 Tax=Spirillospora sp. NPDC048911 TaxID=3364527 RepID=UPI003715B0C6
MNDPMFQPQRARTQTQDERLMETLRAYGATFREISRKFAAWLGLHSTDAEALIEILLAEERGTPLSPARLSERVPLSSGATTALLNRLEQAGHVVRSREHSDRRIVTLRSSPQVHELADRFFGPLGERTSQVMARYQPDLLEQFEKFLIDLGGTMVDHLNTIDDRLNADASRPPAG